MMQVRAELKSGLRTIAAALFTVALPSFVAGCKNEPAHAPDKTAPHASETSSAVSLPGVGTALEPVGRAQILAAAAAAADRSAAGMSLPESNLQLTNRSFELRLPIACAGGAVGNWGEWTFDPETRVLRVNFSPQTWGDDASLKEAAGALAYDAAEGFWIERPWTRSEQCPAVAGVTTGPTVPPDPASSPSGEVAQTEPQTLALVQYFSPDAPRNMRRGGRAYTYTAKLPSDSGSQINAFRARLTGRIVGFGDGQPIHCVARAPSQPPLCVIAVEFAQVVLEDASSGESLADWGD